MKRILILLLLFISTNIYAQKICSKDTVYCDNECIFAIYVCHNKTNDTYYVKYNNPDQNLDDIIPVPKSVVEYMKLCKQTDTHASLSIVTKNGLPYRIIKYCKKYGNHKDKLINLNI
jgi:hypothetical protein